MTARSFAERFRTAQALEPQEYDAKFLDASLYPAARALRPILKLLPDYFAPDREFLNGVSHIRRMEDFQTEADAYIQDPRNRGILRRALRLRVSVRRVHALVRRTLRDSGKMPPR